MCNKIDNLKYLHSKIYHKDAFAKIVAEYYGLNKTYVKQSYLQGTWKIPAERVDTIIDIAQRTILKQIETLQNTYNNSK